MSLSTLRTTYGRGTRHDVINRAIRAECPQGNSVLDSIRALSSRLREMKSDHPQYERLSNRLAHWEVIRAELAKTMEEKHGVGPDLNLRRRAVTS